MKFKKNDSLLWRKIDRQNFFCQRAGRMMMTARRSSTVSSLSVSWRTDGRQLSAVYHAIQLRRNRWKEYSSFVGMSFNELNSTSSYLLASFFALSVKSVKPIRQFVDPIFDDRVDEPTKSFSRSNRPVCPSTQSASRSTRLAGPSAYTTRRSYWRTGSNHRR